MKVGDYVRTKKGYITKILECYGKDEGYKNMEYYSVDKWLHNGGFIIYEEDINKSSLNIIDLIEVGDYVNGKKVGFINDSDYYDDIFLSESWDKPFETMIVANYKDIKSIVTHEQFKSIEYEVK